MSDFPSSWGTARIADLTLYVGSGATPRGGESSYKAVGVPLIRSMNVVFFGFKFDGLAYLDNDQAKALGNAIVQAGDVLLNITGASIGRVTSAPASMDGARVNQHVCIVRPVRDFDGRLLQAYLSSPRMQSQIWADNYGVTRQALTKQQILDFEVPVPPRAEQQRIADKLDTVLARVDALNDRLARVAPLLKRFRQSVLAAATSGRLTADWRDHLDDQTDTPGPPPQWQPATIATAASNQDSLRKPVSEVERRTRRGHFPYYGASGVIDTIDGFTHDGDFLLIGEDGANLLTRSKPIAFRASGRIWVNNHAHVLTHSCVSRLAYLSCAINAIDLTPWVTGSAQPKLTRKAMDSIPVFLPPEDEEAEIVRRVDILFAFADRFEARLQAAQTAASRLTPALLAKAFRGELVPQDPADEPAAELLRRLAASRPVPAKKTRAKQAI